MAEAPATRFPDDPLHPDHAMFQRILEGVRKLQRWGPEHGTNLAAALYADIRDRQPYINARDIDRIIAGDPAAPQPSLFALPREGYHGHGADPAAFRFRTSLENANRPARQSLSAHGLKTSVGQDGFMTDPGILHTPIPQIQHGAMSRPNGIVLHRTESGSATSTLNAWRTGPGGTGAHFLIDKDGTIHQTIRVDRQAWHVGAIRSRGEMEGTIVPEDQRELEHARAGQAEWRAGAVRAVSRVETTRPYPERYPTNGDSLGIEIVARYVPATRTWEAPTPEQTTSIQRLLGILQRNFGLTDHDVYQHDVISRKTPGEGADLYAPALPPAPAPDTLGMPAAGPHR